MKRTKKRFLLWVLVLVISIGQGSFVFAAEEDDYLRMRILPGETYEFICNADEYLNFVYDGEMEQMKYAFFTDEYIVSGANQGWKALYKGDRFIVHVKSGYIEYYCDWSKITVNKLNRPAFVTSVLTAGENAEFKVHKAQGMFSESHLNVNTISDEATITNLTVNKQGQIVRDDQSTYKKGRMFYFIKFEETSTITVHEGEVVVFGSYEHYTPEYSRGDDIIETDIDIATIATAKGQSSATADGYIYDTGDPGTSMNLPTNELANVVDKTTAISAIQSATSGMSEAQKSSATGVDLVTLFAEEAIARAASRTVDGSDILINQESINSLQAISKDVAAAAETALVSGGVTPSRQIRGDVKFQTSESQSVQITIDPSAASTTADNVRVATPAYEISIPAEVIKEAASDSPLVITVANNGAVTGFHTGEILIGYNGSWTELLGSTGASATTYRITFNKPVKENVKVSLPPAAGDPAYQAVTNSTGVAVGGKYNPATQKLDVKIKDSDTYKVQENRKDFSDISSKSKEMQEAIEILASKGIINGTTETQFSPDGAITRAEIATLIVKTLSKYDSNANGNFSDVKASDWYCGAIGSAKQYGIINGLTETTFGPKNNIQKDQIVAIAARTLKSEMKYKDPANASQYLATYTDSGSIPTWAHSDVGLATRENLVLKRTDGTFGASDTMTRGDAAIILYRMFNKIW